jgi:class 3 adenylate cyclase
MKNLLLFLTALGLLNVTRAQDGAIDSLKTIIEAAADDSAKVKSLNALSASYTATDPGQTIFYAEQAEQLALRIGYKKGLALALKNVGLGHYLQANYVDALQHWDSSRVVFDSIGDKTGVANMLSNMGAIYFNQGDNTKALDLYLASLKVSEEINDTLRIATALINIGAVYFQKPATHDQALTYYLQALPLGEALGDQEAIGTSAVNLGEIYMAQGKDSLALAFFERSLKAYDGTEYVPYSLNAIGKLYSKQGRYNESIRYHQQAYDLSSKLDGKLDMAQSLLGIGKTNLEKGAWPLSLSSYLEAEAIAQSIGANYELKDAYEGISMAYSKLNDFANAFRYQSLLLGIKDTLYNIETDKKLSLLLFNFEMEKKQGEIDLLTKDKALQELNLKREKLARNALAAGLIGIFFIVFILYRNYRQKVKTNKLLDRQKAEIESLLLNILPEEVAKELQTNGRATSRSYESVSVLFTDFKGFTNLAEGYTPNDLVTELNDFFVAFDDIIEKYNLEKIKTIGDSYMCAGGIPTANNSHFIDIVHAGLEMQEFIMAKNERKKQAGEHPWNLRIGIHTGPVTAGVVGKKKYAYDIWGDTVNIASRMESSGEIGKVNVSGTTYELIKDQFHCIHRGKIEAKNKGTIDMYFVQNGAAFSQ